MRLRQRIVTLVAQELNILLLTPYGGGNLGDAAIQDAVICHFRKRLSKPRLRLVTLAPRITSELHGLPAFPIASSVCDLEAPSASSSHPAPSGRRSSGSGFKQMVKQHLPFASWLGSVIAATRRTIYGAFSPLRRGWRELGHVLQVYRLLKDTDLLVMSGGGQIDDYWGGAFGQPYALFKWASLARFTRTPVIFLSVGVCSLGSRLGRRFAREALRLAAYRSYRDHGSKELLHEAGFTRNDPEYPDLAFSHPCAQQPPPFLREPGPEKSVIGVSPIAYLSPRAWPERDQAVYDGYLQVLGEFTAKLLDAGHTVVLFTTSLMDQFAVEDLREKLRQNPASESWGGRLRRVEQTCLDRQLEEIREMDLIVASRLHGIILAHLLGKPALAISYDRKVRAHMEAMAQERFCLDLRDCTATQLWDGFTGLGRGAALISTGLRSKVEEFGQKLDVQYDLIMELAGQTAHARKQHPVMEAC
jgi:polysaccharide pyruvyl transferase WcaK-like protein